MRAVASWLDTIGRVFQAIPDLATPEEVQSALREILDDPELRLGSATACIATSSRSSSNSRPRASGSAATSTTRESTASGSPQSTGTATSIPATSHT